jgi:hypothetical protein
LDPVDEHQGNRIAAVSGVGRRRVGVGSAGHDEELPKRDALKTPPPSLYKFYRLRDSNLQPESAFDYGLHKGFIVASIVGDWANDALRPCEADPPEGIGVYIHFWLPSPRILASQSESVFGERGRG